MYERIRRNYFLEQVILIRCGEIALKGLNRSMFENRLMSNIRKRIKDCGESRVFSSQSRIYVEPKEEGFDFEKAMTKIQKIFGVVSLSPVYKVASDFEVMKEAAVKMLAKKFDVEQKSSLRKTFKVETKRGDKRFPMDSPAVSRELGAHILDNFPDFEVDVHHPDFIFWVEEIGRAHV